MDRKRDLFPYQPRKQEKSDLGRREGWHIERQNVGKGIHPWDCSRIANTGWILFHWLLSVYFFTRHRKTPHKFGENLNYWCKSTEPLSWGKIFWQSPFVPKYTKSHATCGKEWFTDTRLKCHIINPVHC